MALLAALDEFRLRLSALPGTEGKVADEIHQIRRLGKQLRGALAVIDEPKACIRWVSVIGRMLGEARDGVVRAKTWAKLGLPAAAPGSIEAAIAALLIEQAAASARRPPQEAVDWCLQAVDQVRGRIEHLGAVEVAGRAEEGANRLKARLRKRLKKTLERVRNEDFHECRKTAKAWLGGVSLVAPTLELPGGEIADRLCDSLGDENDLEVLAVWLQSHGFTPATAGAAWKRLRKRQEKIRRRSIALIRKELLPALVE